MSGTIPIAADQLSALVARLFIAAGVPDTAARTVAGALVDADLEGQSSHGVMLVEMYLDRIRKGSVSLKEAGEIVSDKGATVVLDAQLRSAISPATRRSKLRSSAPGVSVRVWSQCVTASISGLPGVLR